MGTDDRRAIDMSMLEKMDVPAPRTVPAGEDLVRRGEQDGDAYLVESGRFEVLASDGTAVATVGPGELVGEYVALVGGERTATVRAAEPSTVRALDAAALDTLLRHNPALAESLRAEAMRRIQSTRVREALVTLIGDNSPDVVADVLARGTWRRLEAGEYLFAEGEPAHSAFVVVSGRLRRVSTTVPGAASGYAAAGSVVGEEGLARSTRRASVEATRDSVVLEVSAGDFADLLVEHPRVMAPVALGLAGGAPPPRRDLDRTVVLAVTTPDDAHMATVIADEIGSIGSVAHLTSDRVDALLDRSGIAQATSDDPGDIRLREFLARIEHDHCYVLLEPDRVDSEWSRRAMRQADVLVIVASASPDPAEQARIDALVDQAGLRTLRTLVLVHPEATARPQGTSATVERWHPDHILHVRRGDARGLARVARTVAGRPVGLVFGGGGARGFASLGVYRALTALGVPIDAVGGASVGAPLTAAIAQGVTPEQLIDEAERLFHGILDYTLPLVSLLKGERASVSIREKFEGWTIEDLWLPYFCVSTNLTQGRMQIHRRGDVTTALRASVAIPGAFPPVPHGDDLLVDGGVTNNLPADVMRRLYPTATVLAVSVAPVLGPKAKADFGLSVSGWQAMKSKVGRGPRYPGIVAVLMRSMITGSMDRRDAVVANEDADLLLDLDMRGVGLLDFERVREVAAKGYDAAMPRLEEWLSERESSAEGVPRTLASKPDTADEVSAD